MPARPSGRRGAVAALALVVAAQSLNAAPPDASAFEVAPGFRVELVASEPMVVAPVSLAFDEDGRLLVAEMLTYMNDTVGTGERAPRNRVAMLEDLDGDGRMDRRTTFLDGLVLPRGATPYRGGVLVIEPPWLLFAEDLDGDGRADTARRLIDGFGGIESPEHAGNGPLVGLDGWLEFSQHGARVAFDGERVRQMPTSPHGQWGIAMDDVGRLYRSPNSDPLLVDVLPGWTARLGTRHTPACVGRSIADDRAVWPSHPTRGVNRGYQEAVLRPDGTLATFTAACGPTIARTDRLGPAVRGNAFVCETAGNLVARYALEDAEGIPRALRQDRGREFLRSTDERFRPVACAIGPDGALYVADFARGVIQHRLFLTDYLKGQIAERGLEAPLELGRIWRIVPDDWRQPPAPRLSNATDAELVAMLDHADGWWRDTAQRLIVQRGARSEAPALRHLLRRGQPGPGRVHGLRTLELLGELAPDDLGVALDADDAWLCAHALLVAFDRAQSESLPEPDRVLALLDDRRPTVHRHAMLASGPLAARGPTSEAARAARIASLRSVGADGPLLDAFLVGACNDELRDIVSESLAEARPDLLRPALASMCRGDPEDRASAVATCGRAGPTALALLAEVVASPEFERRPFTVPDVAALRSLDVSERSRVARDAIAARLRPVERREPPADADSPATRMLAERGRGVYVACASCHGADGGGVIGTAPALARSTIALGPASGTIRALLHGLTGGTAPSGAPWPTMTPLPLSDEQIAAVLTYVRRSFGNAASTVTAADVQAERGAHAARARPWTREELHDVPTSDHSSRAAPRDR